MVPLRLIERLDGAIAAATQPLQREYLKAERACALARLGLFADARFAHGGLRTQNQRHKDPLLTAWIYMLEAQIEQYETFSIDGIEGKFRRVFDAAKAIDDAPMQALAAAWLANCAINAADLPALAGHLRLALRLADPDHHSARARASLVLADAYRWAGVESVAQDWYLRARAHASADGDGTMISAMLFNKVNTSATLISLADAFGRPNLAQARSALLEAESIANYDWGTGLTSLPFAVPIIRAQFLTVLGRFEEALRLFDDSLDEASGMASNRDAHLLAERAWCQVRLGRVSQALADTRTAEALAGSQRDPDDRAATFARLACLHRHGGREDAAQLWQTKADAALAEFQAQQVEIRRVLDDVLATPGLRV